MSELLKVFWFKSKGDIEDLTKIALEHHDDVFLHNYWHKNYKIVSLWSFGKTYSITIKKGSGETFEYIDLEFKSFEQMSNFLKGIKVKNKR